MNLNVYLTRQLTGTSERVIRAEWGSIPTVGQATQMEGDREWTVSALYQYRANFALYSVHLVEVVSPGLDVAITDANSIYVMLGDNEVLQIGTGWNYYPKRGERLPGEVIPIGEHSEEWGTPVKVLPSDWEVVGTEQHLCGISPFPIVTVAFCKQLASVAA